MHESKALDLYLNEHTSPESDVLLQLNRETHIKVVNSRMLSGVVQGRFLTMICQMLKPQNVLEIGTFTGYSAICMAMGMPDNSMLHTIEVNDELAEMALSYFDKAGVSSKITYHNGNALDIVPNLGIEFDLIFIDGEKREYLEYFNQCVKFLKPGGYIIADNVLWDGKVIDPSQANDSATKAIMAFNDMVQNNSEVENLLLPLRDGLMMIRKKTLSSMV